MTLDAAFAAFNAGDLAAAERLARAAPANDDASFLLARTLATAERFAEAEALLAPLAERNIKPLQFLASLQYRRLAFDACEATLDRLIARAPERASAEEYRRLAKLKNRAGRESEAREVLGKALGVYPGDLGLVVARTDLRADRAEAAVELEQVLAALDAAQPHIKAYLLKRITLCRAPLARAQAGRPEYGLSWEDTLDWPDAAGLERLRRALVADVTGPRPAVSAAIDAAWVALALRKWAGAQGFLDHVRGGPPVPGTEIAAFSHFGAAFHEGLSRMDDGAMERDLAPVHTLILPAAPRGEALFVACDPKYFSAFTLPFLRGAEALAVPVDVHVHLMDGTPAEWTEAVGALLALKGIGITLTAETSGAASFTAARTYYHAARFIRFYQELARAPGNNREHDRGDGPRRLWMIDADARLLRDPRPLFARLDHADLALRTNPLTFEPALKMMACCVGVAATERGLAFARRTAAYIHRMRAANAWGWGVDQVALFSAYAYMEDTGAAPATQFLGADAVCLNSETTGVFQFPSGINKYFQSGP